MLLASDLYEYFVDVESITKPSMLALESLRISWPKLDTPQPDCLVANGNTAFSE